MSTNTISSPNSTKIVEMKDDKGSSSTTAQNAIMTLLESTTENQHDNDDDNDNNTTACTSTSKKTMKKSALIAEGRRMSKSNGGETTTADADPWRVLKIALEGKGSNNNSDITKLFENVLYKNSMFESSEEFRELKARVYDLAPYLRVCLFTFSVFPESAVIKRRLMTYWWMGASFISPDEKAEERASMLFDMLLDKGFILPVHEKRRPVADRCTMHPFVRCSVIKLAKTAGFLDFDPKGNLPDGLSWVGLHTDILTLFNCSEYYLHFTREQSLRMKSLKVLYLGRWKLASAVHHIEVDNTEFTKFLSRLKHMKFLRFFSLQGVSGIRMVPPDSFSKHHNLMILDLRACHSLEVIPESIGNLQTLTHLDISGCYLLKHMPKNLGSLSKLQVLKGFVVKHDDSGGKSSCMLKDLAKLQYLRKLSIFTTMMNFPDVVDERDEYSLARFTALQKLTIEWGEDPITTKDIITTKDFCLRRPFPDNLKKLDLVCLPTRTRPSWLRPCHLPRLEKLYIRGAAILELGEFDVFDSTDRNWNAVEVLRGVAILELGEFDKFDSTDCKWNAVKVLRLKYMTNLQMDWRQLRELFPNLIYVEKVRCPKLDLFPCDERGVWVNKFQDHHEFV